MEAEDVKRIRDEIGKREGKHITQAELARRLTNLDGKRVSRRTVEGWEQELRGVGEENAEKLRKLEEAFK